MGPQRRPQRRPDRRLGEFAEAVGGGHCRLQMPLKLALAVRGTVAGPRLGALEGVYLPPFPVHPSPTPITPALQGTRNSISYTPPPVASEEHARHQTGTALPGHTQILESQLPSQELELELAEAVGWGLTSEIQTIKHVVS